MQFVIDYKTYEVSSPLKLGVRHLLDFAQWCLKDPRHPDPIYERLIEQDTAYFVFSENRALQERLVTLLQIESQVEHIVVMRSRMNRFDRLLVKLRLRKLNGPNLPELLEARKKAYDDYEFYRRLCFTAPDGGEFFIALTEAD